MLGFHAEHTKANSYAMRKTSSSAAMLHAQKRKTIAMGDGSQTGRFPATSSPSAYGQDTLSSMEPIGQVQSGIATYNPRTRTHNVHESSFQKQRQQSNIQSSPTDLSMRTNLNELSASYKGRSVIGSPVLTAATLNLPNSEGGGNAHSPVGQKWARNEWRSSRPVMKEGVGSDPDSTTSDTGDAADSSSATSNKTDKVPQGSVPLQTFTELSDKFEKAMVTIAALQENMDMLKLGLDREIVARKSVQHGMKAVRNDLVSIKKEVTGETGSVAEVTQRELRDFEISSGARTSKLVNDVEAIRLKGQHFEDSLREIQNNLFWYFGKVISPNGLEIYSMDIGKEGGPSQEDEEVDLDPPVQRVVPAGEWICIVPPMNSAGDDRELIMGQCRFVNDCGESEIGVCYLRKNGTMTVGEFSLWPKES